MTYVVPCEDPKNDPNDWFISRDGKQYADDDLLTPEQHQAIERQADAGIPYDEGDSWNEVHDRLTADAEDEARRTALRRRRHAKDACFVDCYFRHQCLELALDGPSSPEEHGTWGGYYEEELRAIRRARDER